ncbi:MAG TPA: class I adenylate-forming enzyme family protein, partial [Acidimicrobiales bacterium]|nr:class I adenylate-forming enzyme family protein [Acidimicrobiales bacterium]
MTATLSEVVAGHAATRPDRPAFLCEGRVTTWQDYDRAGWEHAGRLATAGLEPGDGVAVVLPDGPGVHEWFLGVERAGLVIVGIGPRAGEAEVRHLVERSGARALVSSPVVAGRDAAEVVAGLREGGLDLLHLPATDDAPGASRPVPERPGVGTDELWLLNSTSGTTGLPKCVMHTQSRWMYFHRLAVSAGAMTGDDVFMSLLPAPFGFGLWTAHFTPTLLGAPVAVMPRFNATDALRLAGELRVTVLACVTTQLVMMLNDPALSGVDLGPLRAVFTGGEAVPYERAAEFEDRTGARVLQFYGSNETGALSHTSVADDRDHRLRTAGRVIPDMHVRLLDGDDDVTATGGPGEPVCRGPATSLGYWDDPEANDRLVTADGWMRTGDLAEIDADGYLRIVGRLSDIIIRGGKNISAGQVEAEVGTHPAVAMVAAVPMPDEVFGERVCVYVVARPGPPPSLEDLTDHLLRRGAGKELLPEHLV